MEADGLTPSYPYHKENLYKFVDEWLRNAGEFVELFDMPAFNANLKWLEARRDSVPCVQPTIIHYDFHPANILIREDGSAVVIDWSQFDVSDRRFDLAWTMLLVGAQVI